MRAACCKAAATITQEKSFDERELEECAQLDDALARAHVLLKNTVRDIMLSRIGRRSRAK